MTAWRDNREPGWHKDVGFALQDVLNQHQYLYERKGTQPDDPGWHECSCGWEGYWHGFNPHVADRLREVVVEHVESER